MFLKRQLFYCLCISSYKHFHQILDICAASWTRIQKCVWEKLFLKWCLLTILIRQFFTFLCNWVCNSVIFQAEKIWVTANLWIIECKKYVNHTIAINWLVIFLNIISSYHFTYISLNPNSQIFRDICFYVCLS